MSLDFHANCFGDFYKYSLITEKMYFQNNCLTRPTVFLSPDIDQKQASKLKDTIKRHQVTTSVKILCLSWRKEMHLMTSLFLSCNRFVFVLLRRLQGSITDDKSKATHHIYPSPSQQEEGGVEISLTVIRWLHNHMI